MDELIVEWINKKIVSRGTGSDKIISGVFLIGKNTSDPSASNIDVFKDPNNHVDATSSILAFSADQTNFHPGSQSPESSASSFDEYTQKVSEFPGFTLKSNDVSSITIDGTFSQVKEIISNSYPPKDKAEGAIQRQLSGFLVHSHSDEKNYMFTHTSINNSEGDVSFRILTIPLTISHDDTERAIIGSQMTSLSITEFNVVSGTLVASAETLSKSISKTQLADFTTDITTPYNCV